MRRAKEAVRTSRSRFVPASATTPPGLANKTPAIPVRVAQRRLGDSLRLAGPRDSRSCDRSRRDGTGGCDGLTDVRALVRALRNPRDETPQSASREYDVVVFRDAPQAGRQKEHAVRGHLVWAGHDRSVGQLKPAERLSTAETATPGPCPPGHSGDAAGTERREAARGRTVRAHRADSRARPSPLCAPMRRRTG